MNSGIVTNLWLIPAIPLAASLAILSLANSRRKSAAALAVIGQVAALTLSIVAFLPTLETPGFRASQNFTWFTFGEQPLRIGWVLDPLAAAMLLMIALVGLCIFVFALFAWPLVGRLLGRPWLQAELFGIAPDPTVVATLGVLIAADRTRWELLVVPMLWCAISGATLWAMQSPDALLAPAAALLVLVLACWKMLSRLRKASPA